MIIVVPSKFRIFIWTVRIYEISSAKCQFCQEDSLNTNFENATVYLNIYKNKQRIASEELKKLPNMNSLNFIFQKRIQ